MKANLEAIQRLIELTHKQSMDDMDLLAKRKDKDEAHDKGDTLDVPPAPKPGDKVPAKSTSSGKPKGTK